MFVATALSGFNAIGSTGIQYVGGNTGSALGDTNLSVSLTALTGGLATAAAPGDYVVVFFGASGSIGDHNLSISTAGFSELSEQFANDTDDAELHVAAKFMTSTPDTAVVADTTDSFTGHVMAVQVFRGVHLTTPQDVALTEATGTNTVLANPPSITPVTPGAFVVAGACGAHGLGTQTYSSSDLSNFISTGSNFAGVNDPTVGMGHTGPWASGAINPAAFTWSGSDDFAFSWCAVTMALRPAA